MLLVVTGWFIGVASATCEELRLHEKRHDDDPKVISISIQHVLVD